MQKLSSEEIEAKLDTLPEWSLSGESLQRTYSFQDFLAALAFVNRVGDLAEQQAHHPDILIRYDKVTLTLSTHDVGGITDKDFSLAGTVDDLVNGS